MQQALILIDIWDSGGLSFNRNPDWWEESVTITREKIVPVLRRAREANWIIIHCNSGLNPLPEMTPIVGEYVTPYNAFINADCPQRILDDITTFYFVGFVLNNCMIGNNCGIKQTRKLLPAKELILLQDCTKAIATENDSENVNFEKTLVKIRQYCSIRVSEDIRWND